MKKIKILSLFLLFGVSYSAMAQWTEYPAVDRIKPSYLWGAISTVVATNEHTCVMMAKQGSSISTETYLEYTNPSRIA